MKNRMSVPNWQKNKKNQGGYSEALQQQYRSCRNIWQVLLTSCMWQQSLTISLHFWGYEVGWLHKRLFYREKKTQPIHVMVWWEPLGHNSAIRLVQKQDHQLSTKDAPYSPWSMVVAESCYEAEPLVKIKKHIKLLYFDTVFTIKSPFH